MLSYHPVIEEINFDGNRVDVLRLDLIHPEFGGNKIFKLSYNVAEAKATGHNTLLTFGGPHSNHIYATAALCAKEGLMAIAVIRANPSLLPQSPTLLYAQKMGMQLHFVSREDYVRKSESVFINELTDLYGDFFLIPEGGNNFLGVKGCTEILGPHSKEYDYVFCACGTATTYAGLKISADQNQMIVGVSVLKGINYLIDDVNAWLQKFAGGVINDQKGHLIERSTIINDYHFGGYAKHNSTLLEFKKAFELQTRMPLDYVYTAKLFYGVFDLLKTKRLRTNSRRLIVHGGGLQGNEAYEKKLLGKINS
jgi:1-aminocyclopropane-1-carboxylate deaminase